MHRKVPSEYGADCIFGLGSRPDKSRTSSCGDGQVFRWRVPSRERRSAWAQASPSLAVPVRGSHAAKHLHPFRFVFESLIKKLFGRIGDLREQLFSRLFASHYQKANAVTQKLPRRIIPLVKCRQKFFSDQNLKCDRPQIRVVFHKAVPKETFPADLKRKFFFRPFAVI